MFENAQDTNSPAALVKVIEALPWALYIVDMNLRFRLWNGRLEEITGYSHEEIEQMFPLDLFSRDEHFKISECFAAAFKTGSADIDAEIVRKDGTKIPYYLAGSIIELDGAPCLVGMAIDASARKIAEEALRKSETLFRAMTENARDLTTILSPSGSVLYHSPAVKQILGYEPDELVNEPFTKLMHPDDLRYAQRMFNGALAGTDGAKTMQFRLRHRDGFYRNLAVTASNCIETLGGLLLDSRDITEQSRAEEQIRILAHYDALTGLANRNLLLERLEEAIAEAERENGRGAIVFLDLDRFKAVNDSLGHAQGDLLLRAVAERLRGCVSSSDTAARHGGDEFVIILRDVKTRRDAEMVAADIRSRLAVPYVIDQRELHVACSIGLCVYPADGRDVETLLRHADIAMYEAKNAGGDGVRSFTPEMNARVLAEVEVEADLRRGLKNGEFELHYQPVFSLHSGEVTSFEALLRWNHPERGLVMPADFIGIAENTGLIEPIGAWVLGEACRQLRTWTDAGFPHLGVAVNLSAKQFRRGTLAENVRAVLEETGIAPERLELEITESVIMDQAETGVATLEALSELGVKIAIDDFGTGYSSLAYIKRFPIDRLKVDRTFVRDVTTDRDDAAIVSAIVALGKAVEVSVLAEGVETFDQLAQLRELGCEHVQGFLFSRPVPPDRALHMLRGLSDDETRTASPGVAVESKRNDERIA